jgi:hypothetical protein
MRTKSILTGILENGEDLKIGLKSKLETYSNSLKVCKFFIEILVTLFSVRINLPVWTLVRGRYSVDAIRWSL